MKTSASKRLMHEMGIGCGLKSIFSFVYKAELDNNLVEYEYDHVLFGNYDEAPQINTDEVQNWKYMSMEELEEDIAVHPENYTEWLKLCIDKVSNHFEYAKMEITLQF